ncbi:MAG TPA: aminoglycoside adenylyltransferase domain-containing protein [Dehalococcoidia bacterium]|nr:aminoglycoside adenylyltransferase domain-containing protein [Dehalococcoidia bacterium]
MPDLPPEVVPLLDALLAGIRDALGENIVGVYLRGSLALGDFDPASSDVDLLVVTERPLSDAEFAALARLHDRIDQHAFNRRYEVSYIDRRSIRRFRPGERTHPAICTDDPPFALTGHRHNWVLERWTVREHGVTLMGPEPRTLIDPISPSEIRAAVREELAERDRHWHDGSWPRSEIAHRGAQTFEVHTVCRALHTLATGEVATKPQATAWARANLPAEWQPLLAWADEHRGDLTHDETQVTHVLEFLRWAATST